MRAKIKLSKDDIDRLLPLHENKKTCHSFYYTFPFYHVTGKHHNAEPLRPHPPPRSLLQCAPLAFLPFPSYFPTKEGSTLEKNTKVDEKGQAEDEEKNVASLLHLDGDTHHCLYSPWEFYLDNLVSSSFLPRFSFQTYEEKMREG